MHEARAIPEASASTQLLYARFMALAVGELASRDEIAGVCKSPYERCRGYIATAIRMALRQGVHIGCVPRVGYKRLDASGTAGAVTGRFRHIHRTARRGLREAATVSDPMALPPEQRSKYFAEASCLGMIEHGTKPNALKRLTAATEVAQARLPLDETIKAFS